MNTFSNPFDPAGLNMLQINIRGMNRLEKLDSLSIFLQSLNITVDVLVVGETWLKEGRSRYYNISGFRSIYSCRNNSSGGLALFIRNGLEFDVKKNTQETGYHHIEISILGTQRVTVHGIYRPPDFDVNRFMSLVESILSSVDTKIPCFLLGDMNLAVNDFESRLAQKYLQLLSCYNMVVTNTYPTRPESNNLLDHVISHIDSSKHIVNYTLDCDLSDHCYILTQFKSATGKLDRTLTKTLVNYRQVNSQFQMFLESYNFEALQPSDRLEEITNHYKQLKNTYSTTISVNVKVKQTCCPWYNYDIWKLGKISNNLFQRWKRNSQNQHLKNLLAHANKKLADAKRRAKSSYYQRLLSTNNPKQLWSQINDLLGRKPVEGKKLKLEVDGIQTDDPKEVGNIFNEFFSTVGESVASSLNSDGDINKFNTVEVSTRSIFLRPASESEVMNIVNALDSSKATGVDEFPIAALKHHKTALSRIICTCFNDSVSLGSYPDCLKKAIVYPIFKGGSPTNPTNYRPISVLPAINKVFEKLLSIRLLNFLETTALFYEHQFGFRQGSSTEIAVLELVDDVSHSVDQKFTAGAMFLDLSKAFDTINHSMLLKKLDAYGIRGVANAFIGSYLSDRQQGVVISGIRSDYRNIRCGVPQGSNMGPLLFLIYVNDISNLNIKGQPKLFADDTSISYKSNNVADLFQAMSQDLHLITAYLENNLLSLNLTKTKVMVFGNKDTSSHPKLVVKGKTIEEVTSFKHLGVHIDNRLRWDVHIREMLSSCSSLCGILRKLSRFVPQHVLLTIYYSFIHSRYKYGIAAWGSSSNIHLKDVQIQQNRCMKAIFNLPFLHPTRELYSTMDHNVMPILGLFTFQICAIMFKVVNHLNLHHNWTFNSATHQHRTRYAHLLQQSGFRTEIGRKRFQIVGPNLYNQLPEDIKNAQTFLQFKKYFRTHVKTNIESFIVPR